TALAQALSRDGLRENAIKEAYRELCKVLAGFSARYPEKLSAAEDDVRQMDGATLLVGVHGGEVIEAGSFAEVADDRAIEADYKAAGRRLTPELAKRYAERIADDEDDDSLLDAHITVGALGKMEGVAETLDKEADALAIQWFAEYRVAVKGLSDERRAAYDAIKGMAPQPQRIDPKRPHVRTEDTQDLDGNALATRCMHLMADHHGAFPIANLNRWEVQVLDRELGRKNCLGWYRNPSRPSADAVAVAWQDGQGNWRRMCPDFVFFHGDEENVRASIVDPHGIHLADALPKLRGMAAFAADYGSEFYRIEAVAEIADKLRVLDLKDAGVRAAVADAKDVEVLYRGNAAADY
ncbi:MAG TPA: hypothetical protein VFJ08_00640, partial [Salinisphaera sp.]